jgi:hypothetical protein
VTAPQLNAELRDNLNYLKTNPVLAEATIAANTDNVPVTGAETVVLSTGAVAIPADVGAVYLEAWGHWLVQNYGAGHVNWGIRLAEAGAGVLSAAHYYDYSYAITLGHNANGPFYLRSQDYNWAGTSKTAQIRVYASNITAMLLTHGIGGVGLDSVYPIVLRMVRSY